MSVIEDFERRVRVDLARALYKRIAGRRDMNRRTCEISEPMSSEEWAMTNARVDSYQMAIMDLCAVFDVTEEELRG